MSVLCAAFSLRANSCIFKLPHLVQNVRTEPEEVVCKNLCHLGLLEALAEADVVDKGAVAAAGVHHVKLAVLIQQKGMTSGQHFAVKFAIVRFGLKKWENIQQILLRTKRT